MADWNETRMIEHWRETSALVHRLRHGSEPAGTNPILDGLVRSREHDLFAPAYALWAADNAAMSMRFDDAAKRYLGVASKFRDRGLFDTPWAVHALRSAADSFMRLNALPDALKCFERLLKGYEDHVSEGEVWTQAGALHEAGGKTKQAAQFFGRAANASAGHSRAAQMARFHASRRLARIKSARGWMRPSAIALAQDLASALRARNGKSLARLLSPTHAQFGFIASESGFVNAKVLLDHFKDTLSSSDLRVDPFAVHGDGDKFYLPVRSLVSDLFEGDAVLLIGRTDHGFEWQGVGLGGFDRENPEAMRRMNDLRQRDNEYPGPDREDPPEPPDPPPTPPPAGPPPTFSSVESLGLKCPYPSGMNLRVGMKQFAAKQAAFLYLASLAGPFYWPALGLLVLGESLGSPCGFGPGGFYYGYPPTHIADEFFAVDFARFQPGLAYLPVLTRGTPVLAVAEGIVRFVRGSIPTGTADAAGNGNEVQIAHIRAGEVTPAVISAASSAISTPALRFTSVYIHMMGPSMIPVSVGQFVQRGARLGLMDSTGTSLYDHLHFSLHDNTVAFSGSLPFFPTLGMSVRPTPMDGQALMGTDDGRCMASTNVPIP
jgi:hypothetical protein